MKKRQNRWGSSTHTHGVILEASILIFITLIISLMSYANPFTNMTKGTDANVFAYIVKGINNGEVPYKDMFDHKGPLFFFINWIGQNINFGAIKGIWICQVIAIFFAILFTQKILKKKFGLNNLASYILNFIVNINLIYFLDEGNLVELYAYSAITVALYFMLTLKKGNIKKFNFIIGALMSVVISLKANMIIMWIAYYLVTLIVCIKRKKIRTFLNIILYSFLGALSFGGIVLVYLLAKGALINCLQDYILFNFKYSAIKNNASMIETLTFFIKDSNIPIYIIILISYILCMKRNKSLNIFAIISFILSWYIIIQPGNQYYHYAMMIVPTFIIPLANLYIFFKEKEKNKILKWITIATLGVILIMFPILKYIDKYIRINITKYREDPLKVQIGEYIKQNTTPEEKMLVIGNDCSYYLFADRTAASKYMYQYPICIADNSIIEKTSEDIKKNLPKYIVMLKYQRNTLLTHSITETIEGKYKKVKENERCILYEKNN